MFNTTSTNVELLKSGDTPTVVALVGVQSHQFHRALDLAALAHRHGARNAIRTITRTGS